MSFRFHISDASADVVTQPEYKDTSKCTYAKGIFAMSQGKSFCFVTSTCIMC